MSFLLVTFLYAPICGFTAMGKTFRRKVGRRGRKRMRRMRKKGAVSIAKTVKRVLYKQAETKHYSYTGTVTLTNDQMYVYNPLVGIVKGTDQHTRVGESVRVIGYKVVYAFTPSIGVTAAQTRLRFVTVKGEMWSTSVTAPTVISAASLDLGFGTPRVGTEVFNRDTGSLLLNRTWIPRFQLDLATSTVAGGVTTYDQNVVVPAKRFRYWLPMRGQRVQWRSDTSNSLFRFPVPTHGIYTWNPALANGNTAGVLGYTVYVYYKDM